MENTKYYLDKLDHVKMIFDDEEFCIINNIKDYEIDLYSDRPSCIRIDTNLFDPLIKEYFDNRKYVNKVMLYFVGVGSNDLCANSSYLIYKYNVNDLIQNIRITDLEVSFTIEGDFHVWNIKTNIR